MGAGGIINDVHEKIADLLPLVMKHRFYPTNSGARDRLEMINSRGAAQGTQDDLEFLARLITEAARPKE
jgi:hypothetical protein